MNEIFSLIIRLAYIQDEFHRTWFIRNIFQNKFTTGKEAITWLAEQLPTGVLSPSDEEIVEDIVTRFKLS
jgi:hypothetical protein